MEEIKEGFSTDVRGPDKVGGYVRSNIGISRDDKGPRDAGFFKLNVASLLPGSAVADALKHTN